MTTDAVRLPLMMGVIIGGAGEWTLAAHAEISRFQAILRQEAARLGREGRPGVQVVFTIPGNVYKPRSHECIRTYDSTLDLVVYTAVVPEGMPPEELSAFVIERLADAVTQAERRLKRRHLPFDLGLARAILERLV